VVATGSTLAGFIGYDRLSPATAGRDQHGIIGDRRSCAPTQTTIQANLQVFYVSAGTRTRDLRRDRPVRARLVQPAGAGITGPEQAFSSPSEPAVTLHDGVDAQSRLAPAFGLLAG
jgi:hypothetical protein